MFRALLAGAHISEILLHRSEDIFGPYQSMQMPQASSQRQCGIPPLNSLIQVAEMPESECSVCLRMYPGIKSHIARSERSMNALVVKSNCVFQMVSGGEQPTSSIGGLPQSVMCILQQRRVFRALRAPHQFFGNLRGGP